MSATSFLHPGLGFIVAALGVLAAPKAVFRAIPLIPAIIALIVVSTVAPGEHMTVEWLGLKLSWGRVDALAVVFAHVFAVQSILGVTFALHVKDKSRHFFALLYVGGAFGCVFAGDYLTLLLFWELMSVASTMLIWMNRTKASTRAGFRYFLMHTFGGLLLFAGLLLRWQALGNFDFVPVNPAAMQIYDWLILAGFAVNAAVVPLHAWLPDAYPEATVEGAVFMSAFTTKTAVYVLARAFAGTEALAIVGVVMCLWGVCYATIENNARRILAYHIVSQVGYMVAGIGIGTAMTVNGACAHAYAHILYKGLLFMSVGALLFSAGTAKLTELGGMVRRLPLVFILYMFAAVSISGVPLFNGFVSKAMTITGTAEAHRTWIALLMEIAAVGTFLSVGLKLPYFAFFAKPADMNRPLTPVPLNMYIAMAGAAALCLVTGLFPNLLYQFLPFRDGAAAYSPFVTGQDHVAYNPWTAYHVLEASLLLGFTGLGFYLMRKIVVPHVQRNLDFEALYRVIGRTFLAVVSAPIAWADSILTEVYRVLGIGGLKAGAAATNVVDQKVIDGVLDGSVQAGGAFGRLLAMAQTGRLQGYTAAALVIGFVFYAAVWFLG